jgi:tRNA1Val (adenine37-N6)-methyltransferase
MFTFKQFTVSQERAAMKVCTDSCLFGALIQSEHAQNALDIGTGTGLLSLMVAQRYPHLRIDAVEIDQDAVKDATENINSSPFSEQIQVHCTSIQSFLSEKSYDLIFCNPPFYENRLASPDPKRKQAHHAGDLNFQELSAACTRLLKKDGKLWLLLPPYEMRQFRTAHPQWQVVEQITVRHRADKPVFREINCLSLTACSISTTAEYIIYETENYSSNFVSALKDYYIIF